MKGLKSLQIKAETYLEPKQGSIMIITTRSFSCF